MKIARLPSLLLLVAWALLLGGCAPKQTPAPVHEGDTSKTSGGEAGDSKAGGSVEEAAKPSDIPAELKHEAFDYCGLDSTKPATYQISIRELKQKQTTEQTVKLQAVKNGEAIYEVEAGPLRVEYIVRKDGVYARQIDESLDQEPKLQLPNLPTPGRSWNTTEKITQNGKVMTTSSVSKIVGVRKIDTARGSFSALLVESTGTVTEGDFTTPISAKSWFVKGLGMVKSDATMRTRGSSKPVHVVSEIQ